MTSRPCAFRYDTVSAINFEIFFLGDPERAVHVEIPGLSEDGDRRGFRREQRGTFAILLDRILGKSRGAERRQLGVFQLQALGAREELLVFRIRTGPAAFDIIDAELVEFLRNQEFVLNRKGDGLALRAVPQRRIESKNLHLSRLSSIVSLSPKTKGHRLVQLPRRWPL